MDNEEQSENYQQNNNKKKNIKEIKLLKNKGDSEIEEEINSGDAIPNPDFSKIDSQDPLLKEGYKLVFQKEIPMDIKIQTKKENKEISSFEAITFKVFKIQSSSNSIPTHIKIELSSENDLFFNFTSIIDEEIFKVIKEKQNLTIDYKDFLETIEELCENCLNDAEIYIAIFLMKKDGSASLNIIKELDVKYIELLKLEFVNSPDEVIKKQMLYRFAALKSKLDYYKNCLEITGDIILEKNPSIISQMLEYNEAINNNTQTTDNDNNFE